MGALISYLLLALVVSFICSLTESVLLSTPKTFLMSVKEKEKWAHSFIKMKSNIDRPLSAILSLNTIAHTIGAAGVGVEATKEFGDASLGIVSAIMTILIIAREISIGTIRQYLLEIDNENKIKVNFLGKFKTFFQICSIGIAIIFIDTEFALIVEVAVIIAAALSWLSLLNYSYAKS